MFDKLFIARFEAKFEKTEGCWLWTASVAGKGYGQMKLPRERRQEYAHRLAYLIYRGEIEPGQYVCHTCDTPACVNPKHLFLGTCKDNQQDMKRKGRSTYGEKNARAQLSEREVKEIRACLAAGMTQVKIAKAFGIHQVHVSRIKTGKRWSHVT